MMAKKYDAAVGRSQTHQDRLNRLADRFSSLEQQLGQLESKIETELPKLGIDVSPLGNRRKSIKAIQADPTQASVSRLNTIEVEAASGESVAVEPNVNVSRPRKPKPR